MSRDTLWGMVLLTYILTGDAISVTCYIVQKGLPHPALGYSGVLGKPEDSRDLSRRL